MSSSFVVAYHKEKDTQAQFQGVMAEDKDDAVMRFSAVFPDATILKVFKEV